MTTLIVAGAQHVGSALVKTAGTAALSYANSAITRAFDNRTFEGPRLESFHLQTSRDGAPMSRVYGRIRLAGQVIWASRLKETATEERVQSGKGGGPTQRNYSYTISFAIGLCEGEILGVDRLWANGAPLNMPGLVMRVYKGAEDQLPDPIISAIDGVVPAFRGTAYIVFEDFPLDDYGARLPQINAEVIRVPSSQTDQPRLETMVRGINLLPASGEFAYATQIAEETPTPTSARPINMNNLSGKPDMELALDQLETQLPNIKNVSIITAWFGTDLRCGECQIKPGVETKTRITPDVTWQVSGVKRGTAYLVSQDENGRSNYGGTPSDRSILQAITALKARGYQVTLYPFILMDIPAGNGLPDPYGAAEQANFPWRGRITCYPQSSENTASVIAQIEDFFGSAQISDFTVSDGLPDYSGVDTFSYRRFILHYAKLAAVSGQVDRFVIGSEMRGLTTLRGGNNSYLAVGKLAELAQDVKVVLGLQTGLTYAADWSEYFGHHPQDASGDATFHLDPLWSSSAIDAIGIDAYFPLSDWRDGDAHLDTALAASPYDKSYLQGQMEGGEGYDYFYVSPADRDTQIRTPITDGSVNKPWVYRYKDLRSWWAQPHYNRSGGIEDTVPTDWTPQSKPIWLMEIGCPAIHNGANQPNVFFDAKSSETSIPFYSNGARDDLIQRRYLEAFIDYWTDTHNPQSNIYNGAMIDIDMINVWCWDARPFPDFPARSHIWSDGDNWQRGHWLSGRMGLIPLADVVADICAQSGLTDVDTSQLTGLVQGYHIDQPMTGRAALTPLAGLYGFDLIDSAQGLRFESVGARPAYNLSADDLIGDLSLSLSQVKTDPEIRVKDVRVHFIDASNDYQLGLASARDQTAETVRIIDINAPLVMDRSFAHFMANNILSRAVERDRSLTFTLSGARLDLEVGDNIALPGAENGETDIWRIESLEGLSIQRVSAQLADAAELLPLSGPVPAVTSEINWAIKPTLAKLDIPGPYAGPLVGIIGSSGSAAVISGPEGDITVSGSVHIGALLTDMLRGPVGRWDYQTKIDVLLSGVNLSSISPEAALTGGNRFTVETQLGWEIFYAASADLIDTDTYRLSTLLRGMHGSAADMIENVSAGARLIWLGPSWQALPLSVNHIGETVTLAAISAGRTGEPLLFEYCAKHLRPFAPVHARLRHVGDQGLLSWIRQTRHGGDNWSGLDVPIGEETEIYRVQLLMDETLIANYETHEPHISLNPTEIMNSNQITIAQGSRAYGWGSLVSLPV